MDLISLFILWRLCYPTFRNPRDSIALASTLLVGSGVRIIFAAHWQALRRLGFSCDSGFPIFLLRAIDDHDLLRRPRLLQLSDATLEREALFRPLLLDDGRCT